MAIMGLAGVSSVGAASLAEELSAVSGPVERVLAKDLRIRWQAKVNDLGGEFRLYAHGPQGFRLVASRSSAQPRASETSEFEITDSFVRSGIRTYQLRFRDSEGQETVLITSSVEVEQIVPVPNSGTASTALALALMPTEMPGLVPPPPGDSGIPADANLAGTQWILTPLSPPPRA